MQEVEYIRKMNNSSLLITAEYDCVKETDSIEMFHYNKIPYFLSMQKQISNSQMQFCYDITGKLPLDQMLEMKELESTLLQRILYSFDQACIQVENYMLSENDIVLKPEFIFSEASSERILFCYVPENDSNIQQQFCELMEYLLQHLNHKDEAAIQLAYGIYQKISEEAEGLHTVLSQMKTGGVPTIFDDRKKAQAVYPIETADNEREVEREKIIKNENTDITSAETALDNTKKRKKEKHADVPETKHKEPVKKQAAEKLKHVIRKKLYTDNYRDFEEESVYEPDMEEEEMYHPTVCLTQGMEGNLNHFIYQGMDRNRDFQCTGEKIILGSSEKGTDICIPLPMISRIHAKIEISEQGTFIEDLNSTNGTLVNGEIIKYRERRQLQKGDLISLAGETYSFH